MYLKRLSSVSLSLVIRQSEDDLSWSSTSFNKPLNERRATYAKWSNVLPVR